LDGSRTDAARAAVEQGRFAGSQPSAIEDIRPDGEEIVSGDRRPRSQIHSLPDWAGTGRRERCRGSAYPPPASSAQTRSPTRQSATPLPTRVDHAGDFEPRQVAAPLAVVDTAPRRCRMSGRLIPAAGDFDSHFSRRGAGIRTFNQLQNLRRTRFRDLNCAHELAKMAGEVTR
jgi:hypothetical protein